MHVAVGVAQLLFCDVDFGISQFGANCAIQLNCRDVRDELTDVYVCVVCRKIFSKNTFFSKQNSGDLGD